jgi:glutamate-ammonia-ligase adenylyltransferase
MRMAMQQDCSERNLKRGEGGTVDVEFAIQALQLKHARDNGSLLFLGTLAAIKELVSHGFLDPTSGRVLAENYQFLRCVEARLRLINTTARHDLPTEGVLLHKLAFLLDFSSATELCESVEAARRKIREQYLAIFSCLASSS